MIKQNFKAIGRIPGECIFVHQDDVPLLKQYGYPAKVRCIAIDFLTRKISEPSIAEVLLKFVPHDIICSEGELEVISDLVEETISERKIDALNRLFDKTKYF